MLLRIAATLAFLSLILTSPVSAEGDQIEWVMRGPGGVEFRGTGDAIELSGLTRGTYLIDIYWRGIKIASRSISINDRNVALTIDLPFRDLSFEVRDLKGRVLRDVEVRVSPEVYSDAIVSGGVVSLIAVPESVPLNVRASWENKELGSRASILITDIPEGLAMRGVIRLPVGDVVLVVLDQRGNALAGAEVYLNGVSKVTNSFGEAVFEMVPLEMDGEPITYDLRILFDGIDVTPSGSEEVTVSTSIANIVIPAQLYELRVKVIGDVGQGLGSAEVRIIREGEIISVETSDAGGLVIFDRLPIGQYRLEALWLGLRGEVLVGPSDLRSGKVVEVRLPVYIELFGIPLSFTSLVFLMVLLVAIIVAVAIVVVEYNIWRGKRVAAVQPRRAAE